MAASGRHAPSPPHASTVSHRVPFYETDAMGIVHHANFVRWLELARIAWMDQHDRPYREYVGEGLHFATTHVQIDYHRAATFDEHVEIETWLERVRGASLRMAYVVRRAKDVIATGATEHALVDESGRPRRMPAERRERLKRLAAAPPLPRQ